MQYLSCWTNAFTFSSNDVTLFSISMTSFCTQKGKKVHKLPAFLKNAPLWTRWPSINGKRFQTSYLKLWNILPLKLEHLLISSNLKLGFECSTTLLRTPICILMSRMFRNTLEPSEWMYCCKVWSIFREAFFVVYMPLPENVIHYSLPRDHTVPNDAWRVL